MAPKIVRTFPLLIALSLVCVVFFILRQTGSTTVQTPTDINTTMMLAFDNPRSPLLPDCPKDWILCGVNKEYLSLFAMYDIELLKEQHHRMVTTGNSTLCNNFTNMGNYLVCTQPPFKPWPGSCLAYSFGVGVDWSFDIGMSKYGCEVHSFDPCLGLDDHLHEPGIHFHNLGLWGSDMVNNRKWSLAKLSTVRKKLGHQTRVIDVLKVDVEIGEWPFLRNVLVEEPEQLDTVRQLVLELHTPQTLDREVLVEIIYYSNKLAEKGFRVFQHRLDFGCCSNFPPFMPAGVSEKCCYETFYVNTRFLAGG